MLLSGLSLTHGSDTGKPLIQGRIGCENGDRQVVFSNMETEKSHRGLDQESTEGVAEFQCSVLEDNSVRALSGGQVHCRAKVLFLAYLWLVASCCNNL